jgi:hypothetical protein
MYESPNPTTRSAGTPGEADPAVVEDGADDELVGTLDSTETVGGADVIAAGSPADVDPEHAVRSASDTASTPTERLRWQLSDMNNPLIQNKRYILNDHLTMVRNATATAARPAHEAAAGHDRRGATVT